MEKEEGGISVSISTSYLYFFLASTLSAAGFYGAHVLITPIHTHTRYHAQMHMYIINTLWDGSTV